MNAYGRISHSLIVYALRHYHFPEWLVRYMVEYFDELVVRISTRQWKIDWFFYMIGLFPIVFNLLIDYLQAKKELGYKPSFASDETSNRAFADDLTLLSSRIEKSEDERTTR